MNLIQAAQGLSYGFKSETAGDLSKEHAEKLVKLKDYARELGLVVISHPDGVNIQVLERTTFQPIAKNIGI